MEGVAQSILITITPPLPRGWQPTRRRFSRHQPFAGQGGAIEGVRDMIQIVSDARELARDIALLSATSLRRGNGWPSASARNEVPSARRGNTLWKCARSESERRIFKTCWRRVFMGGQGGDTLLASVVWPVATRLCSTGNSGDLDPTFDTVTFARFSQWPRCATEFSETDHLVRVHLYLCSNVTAINQHQGVGRVVRARRRPSAHAPSSTRNSHTRE